MKKIIFTLVIICFSSESIYAQLVYRSMISINNCKQITLEYLANGTVVAHRKNVDCSADILSSTFNLANFTYDSELKKLTAPNENGKYFIIPFNNYPVQRINAFCIDCWCSGGTGGANPGYCKVGFGGGNYVCTYFGSCSCCEMSITFSDCAGARIAGGAIVIQAEDVAIIDE